MHVRRSALYKKLGGLLPMHSHVSVLIEFPQDCYYCARHVYKGELHFFFSVGRIGDFLIARDKCRFRFANRDSRFKFSNFMPVSAKRRLFFYLDSELGIQSRQLGHRAHDTVAQHTRQLICIMCRPMQEKQEWTPQESSSDGSQKDLWPNKRCPTGPF